MFERLILGVACVPILATMLLVMALGLSALPFWLAVGFIAVFGVGLALSVAAVIRANLS